MMTAEAVKVAQPLRLADQYVASSFERNNDLALGASLLDVLQRLCR